MAVPVSSTLTVGMAAAKFGRQGTSPSACIVFLEVVWLSYLSRCFICTCSVAPPLVAWDAQLQLHTRRDCTCLVGRGPYPYMWPVSVHVCVEWAWGWRGVCDSAVENDDVPPFVVLQCCSLFVGCLSVIWHAFEGVCSLGVGLLYVLCAALLHFVPAGRCSTPNCHGLRDKTCLGWSAWCLRVDCSSGTTDCTYRVRHVLHVAQQACHVAGNVLHVAHHRVLGIVHSK
jgi:hypothetical protein